MIIDITMTVMIAYFCGYINDNKNYCGHNHSKYNDHHYFTVIINYYHKYNYDSSVDYYFLQLSNNLCKTSILF